MTEKNFGNPIVKPTAMAIKEPENSINKKLNIKNEISRAKKPQSDKKGSRRQTAERLLKVKGFQQTEQMEVRLFIFRRYCVLPFPAPFK